MLIHLLITLSQLYPKPNELKGFLAATHGVLPILFTQLKSYYLNYLLSPLPFYCMSQGLTFTSRLTQFPQHEGTKPKCVKETFIPIDELFYFCFSVSPPPSPPATQLT